MMNELALSTGPVSRVVAACMQLSRYEWPDGERTKTRDIFLYPRDLCLSIMMQFLSSLALNY